MCLSIIRTYLSIKSASFRLPQVSIISLVGHRIKGKCYMVSRFAECVFITDQLLLYESLRKQNCYPV